MNGDVAALVPVWIGINILSGAVFGIIYLASDRPLSQVILDPFIIITLGSLPLVIWRYIATGASTELWLLPLLWAVFITSGALAYCVTKWAYLARLR